MYGGNRARVRGVSFFHSTMIYTSSLYGGSEQRWASRARARLESFDLYLRLHCLILLTTFCFAVDEFYRFRSSSQWEE